MAENLQLLKKRIRTALNISQIAKAMEMIASSKIKRAQTAVERNRPYADKITNTVERILANIDVRGFEHPYLQKRGAGAKLVVAISPDKGLCGGLNANLLRKLQEFETANTRVVARGKKAERFAVRYGYELMASFPGGSSFPKYDTIFPVLDIITREFLENRATEVYLLFTEFRSLFAQVPAVVQLLPVEPLKGTGSTYERLEEVPYIFEPDAGMILRELLPYYVEVRLYNAVIQAFTAEQAARMVAMQNAKENAHDIGEFLTRTYNRSRQEKITSEILDLANGQNA
jgi:F-type H+-transporting ATPase subunit gamma